ncbi:hypothetical protein [Microbacterium sp. B19]|uniref:hypothetical protein n=1 Tax=Microbacterium sp. B19 TaxID=96765 RepID=UPI000346625A|nr:hypothetical protein [Microbacterium sp. B19]
MKRLLRVGSVCALAVVLSGCAADDVDETGDAAAQTWLAEVSAARADTPGLWGSVMGLTGDTTVPVGGIPEGMTLGSEEPTTVSAAEIRCYGGGTASVEIAVSAEGSGVGLQTDIACDEQPHRVEIGDDAAPLSGVTSVRVDVRTAETTTFFAEVYT